MNTHDIVFPAPSGVDDASDVAIPLFISSQDEEGAASHVPHMSHFYDNSLQTALMRDLAIDMETLGEHLVLLGNQVCALRQQRSSVGLNVEFRVIIGSRKEQGCG